MSFLISTPGDFFGKTFTPVVAEQQEVDSLKTDLETQIKNLESDSDSHSSQIEKEKDVLDTAEESTQKQKVAVIDVQAKEVMTPTPEVETPSVQAAKPEIKVTQAEATVESVLTVLTPVEEFFAGVVSKPDVPEAFKEAIKSFVDMVRNDPLDMEVLRATFSGAFPKYVSIWDKLFGKEAPQVVPQATKEIDTLVNPHVKSNQQLQRRKR